MNKRTLPAKPSEVGTTLIEAMTTVAMVAVVLVLVLPALSNQREDAQVSQCADHLRRLAAANLQYVEDFKGKFFYDWERSQTISGKEEGNWQARWWDQNRIGRYVQGIPLQHKPPISAVKIPGQEIKRLDDGPFVNNAGLGGGLLACPSDEGAARSYHQNFWASGIDFSSLPPPDERDLASWKRFPGMFFDSNNSVPHDRLILFSEMLALFATQQHAEQKSIDWATGGEFGSLHTTHIRFAGTDWPALRYRNPGVVRRWPKDSFPVQLDYARHGGDRLKVSIEGGVNIAYADGHVAWMKHTDLYDSRTGISRYNTLWSGVDQRADQVLEQEFKRHESRIWMGN